MFGVLFMVSKHKIEFTFDLPKFRTSGILASIASILVLLALVIGGYTDLKKKKNA